MIIMQVFRIEGKTETGIDSHMSRHEECRRSTLPCQLRHLELESNQLVVSYRLAIIILLDNPAQHN
jgi:hypothetical protein